MKIVIGNLLLISIIKMDRMLLRNRNLRKSFHVILFCLFISVLFPIWLEAQLNVRIDSVTTINYPQVKILFSVTKNGFLVSNLSLSDLELLEDGQSRNILTLNCDTASGGSDVSVLLILDHSGSMAGEPLTDVKDAATSFIDQLGANDEVGVTIFDSKIQLLIGFTTDKPAVKQAIQSIMLGDYTNLWEACMDGLNTISPRTKRKAIVLLSDGFNNINSGYTVNDAIQLAKQLGIPFYSIGLGNEVDSLGLSALATQTGGKYFYSPTSKDLEEIYREIAKIINNLS